MKHDLDGLIEALATNSRDVNLRPRSIVRNLRKMATKTA